MADAAWLLVPLALFVGGGMLAVLGRSGGARLLGVLIAALPVALLIGLASCPGFDCGAEDSPWWADLVGYFLRADLFAIATLAIALTIRFATQRRRASRPPV